MSFVTIVSNIFKRVGFEIFGENITQEEYEFFHEELESLQEDYSFDSLEAAKKRHAKHMKLYEEHVKGIPLDFSVVEIEGTRYIAGKHIIAPIYLISDIRIERVGYTDAPIIKHKEANKWATIQGKSTLVTYLQYYSVYWPYSSITVETITGTKHSIMCNAFNVEATKERLIWLWKYS